MNASKHSVHPMLDLAPSVSYLAEVLTDAIQQYDRVTVLVTSARDRQALREALAAYPALTLGLDITTRSSFVADLWNFRGDGRRLVTAADRIDLVQLLTQKQDDQALSSHEQRIFSRLVRAALPNMLDFVAAHARDIKVHAEDVARYTGESQQLVSAQEFELLQKSQAYSELLKAYELIEEVEALRILATELLDAHHLEPLVLVGFSSDACSPAFQALLKTWAKVSAVHEFVCTESFDYRRALGVETVPAHQRLRLVLPAGPTAEAEALVKEIEQLAASGARCIELISRRIAYHVDHVQDKLLARGFELTLDYSLRLMEIPMGAALVAYLQTLQDLQEREALWDPHEAELPFGYHNMQWWYPSTVIDVLYTPLSGVGVAAIQKLDAAWRSNRLLTPTKVLQQLQSGRSTSQTFAQATRAFCAQNFSQGFKLLASGLSDAAPLLARDLLDGCISSAYQAEKLASTYGLPTAQVLLGLLESAQLQLHHHVVSDGGAGTLCRATSEQLDEKPAICVVCTTPDRAASWYAQPTDASILCDMDSELSALPSTDGLVADLLEILGAAERRDVLTEAEEQLAAIAHRTRKSISFERLLFRDNQAVYPSPILSEILSSLENKADQDSAQLGKADLGNVHSDKVDQPKTKSGKADQSGVKVNRPKQVSHSEVLQLANLSISGNPPQKIAEVEQAAHGSIDADLRQYVVIPRASRALSSKSEPVLEPELSASQIETYLRCPVEWFSMRRLKLDNIDAGFSGLEIGTFVHHILERSYTELIAAGLRPRDLTWIAELTQSIERNFEAERLLHLTAPTHDHHTQHRLVVHTEEEAGRLRDVKRSLEGLAMYQAALFKRFYPIACEWPFNQASVAPRYAGVLVSGTVDRIDVDDEGNALIIDYKHKSPTGFNTEYDVDIAACEDEDGFHLPRHIQALMYAQVVQRAFPDLTVRGSLYLSTRRPYALAGIVDEQLADRIFGLDIDGNPLVVPGSGGSPDLRGLSVSKQRKNAIFLPGGKDAFQHLLDACEQELVPVVQQMLCGDISVDAVHIAQCEFCKTYAMGAQLLS